MKRKEIIEEIYQAYPLKKSKANALKAIEKALTKIDYEPLLQIVQTYAKARTLPNGKCANYTPHPATWFNGECWEDDQDTWLIDELRLENNEPKNPHQIENQKQLKGMGMPENLNLDDL